MTCTAVCPHQQPPTDSTQWRFYVIYVVRPLSLHPTFTPNLLLSLAHMPCLAPRSKRRWRNLRTRSASWMLHGTSAGAVTAKRSSRRGTFQEACFSTSMPSPTRLCLCPTCEQIVRSTAGVPLDGKRCIFEEAGPTNIGANFSTYTLQTAEVARIIDAVKSYRGLSTSSSMLVRTREHVLLALVCSLQPRPCPRRTTSTHEHGSRYDHDNASHGHIP